MRVPSDRHRRPADGDGGSLPDRDDSLPNRDGGSLRAAFFFGVIALLRGHLGGRRTVGTLFETTTTGTASPLTVGGREDMEKGESESCEPLHAEYTLAGRE